MNTKSTALHAEIYGVAPTCVVRAPGRINLIGEHIDYLEGFVLPAAIGKSLKMAVSPGQTGRCRFWSDHSGEEPVSVDLADLYPRQGKQSWLNYCVGVMDLLREEVVSELPSFDASITSDIPPGAGLSSSAALETATALAVSVLSGVELDPVVRAHICQKAEHRYANVPCGIMDQLAVGCSVAGHALLLDCLDCSMRPVPIPAGTAIVVADTQVKHALGDGEYRRRREDCESALKVLEKDSFREVALTDLERLSGMMDPQLYRRARHAISEMSRVSQFVAALESANAPEIGRLLRAGHESLRDDFEVSCRELDHLVAAAYEFGAIGARMTGGGFGGSTITLVQEDCAPGLVDHLEQSFKNQFGRQIHPFVTEASAGASVEVHAPSNHINTQ